VALYRVEDAASRGRVETGAGDHITRFVEKDPAFQGPAWVNGGLYALSSRVWDVLPAGPSSLERDVLPTLAADGRLTGLPTAGQFYDIGTPEEWERAERRFAS
jgi:NDP-sugar pyrophosphorylase family protein